MSLHAHTKAIVYWAWSSFLPAPRHTVHYQLDAHTSAVQIFPLVCNGQSIEQMEGLPMWLCGGRNDESNKVQHCWYSRWECFHLVIGNSIGMDGWDAGCIIIVAGMWKGNSCVSKRAISVPVSPHVSTKDWLVNYTCGFSTAGIQWGSGLAGCQTHSGTVSTTCDGMDNDECLHTPKLRLHRNNWGNETNPSRLNSRWIVMFTEDTGSWSQLSKIVTQVCGASSALHHIQPAVTGMWVEEEDLNKSKQEGEVTRSWK